MLNKVMHKTRLTQNRKAKHTSNVKKKKKKTKKKKKKKGRERKSDRIIQSHFPSTPYKNLFVQRTLDPTMKGKS